MINITMKKRLFSILFILTILCFFFNPSSTSAEKMTHTVVKGDTLWDICEKYYGDADLWPKLWEMNPFITNPHLLEPGDVIVLFEKGMIEKEKPIEITEKASEEGPAGISVAGVINTDTAGYLAHDKISSWGTLFATEDGKIFLSEGDTVFVILDKDKKAYAGDEFSIIEISQLLKNPVDGKKLGYIFSVQGKLVIEEATGQLLKDGVLTKKENVFKATISEDLAPINIDNQIIPYEPISPCILPLPSDENFLGNIVAVKDQLKLFSEGNIVYLNKGFNEGVRRGNLFEVVNTNIVPDPEDNKKIFTNPDSLILPDIPIGIILVLESRPATATAVVIQASKTIHNGAYIKGIPTDRHSDLLSSLPSCTFE
jgi:hypothetical protein